MLALHQSALYLHIAVGSCALLLFWVPVFTRKGNLDHKRFGRYFASAMYVVSVSGIVMSSLDLLWPLSMHAADLELTSAEAESARRQIREFGLFLFSLSILVLTSTRHGWLSILHKDNREPLRNPLHLALNGSLFSVGIVLLSVGINAGNILFIIFGVLEVVTSTNNFRYIFRKNLRPKEWWFEHLSGLIGSGIGAYTAFTVFGGRQLFEELFASNFEDLTIMLWIAPGIIGTIAIAYSTRYYKNKFGGEWVSKRSSLRREMFS